MLEAVEALVLKAKEAADIIKHYPGRIRVLAHYDCDGVSSAAIMAKALAREEKEFHLSFIKQMSREEAEKLSREDGKLFIFLDFGAGQLEPIQQHLCEKAKVVICDHHQPQGREESQNLIHVNPVTFGITENISGAGVTYVVARALNPANRDLSEIAIIGAIGDAQMGSIGPDWGLVGLNKEILKDAAACGKIKIKKGLRLWGRYTRPLHKALEYSDNPAIPGVSGSESASVQFLKEIGIPLKKGEGGFRTLADLSEEEAQRLATAIIAERMKNNHENPEWIFGDVYELLDKTKFRDANEFITLLNASGKLQKPYLGIAVCLNALDSLEEVDRLLSEYRREIGVGIRRIKDIPYQEKGNSYHVVAGDAISEHILSNVVSTLYSSGELSNGKPIFAYANTDNGLGVKISARAKDNLVKAGINLKEIVEKASKECGGEGGGHAGAAGATIPKENLETFINSVENQLNQLKIIARIESHGKEAGKDRGSKGGAEAGAAAGKDSRGHGEGGKKVEREGLVRYFGS